MNIYWNFRAMAAKRRSILVAGGTGLLVVLGILAVLALLVFSEPDFYRKAAVAPGEQRKQWSNEFQIKLAAYKIWTDNERERLALGQPSAGDPCFKFTQEQINSYFDEDLVRSDAVRKVLPDGISAPRIVIDPDLIRLGFRYGSKPGIIVSLTLRAWMARAEPNAFVLQVEGLNAGLLPINAQFVLDRLADSLRQRGADVSWYRSEGKPVAVLRFARAESSAKLTWLQLKPGAILTGSGGLTPSKAAR